MRICSLEGCNREHYGRGLCQMHYRRQHRTGSTTGRDTDRQTPSGFTERQIQRFWTHVDQAAGPDACWPWTGAIDDRAGYGVWHFTTTQRVPSHRAALAIATNEPIPDDLDVDHVYAKGCRSRACCNPSHLEAVTHAENMRRLPVCRKGHEVTGDNIAPANSRRGIQCRICRDERTRKSHTRRKNRSTTK